MSPSFLLGVSTSRLLVLLLLLEYYYLLSQPVKKKISRGNRTIPRLRKITESHKKTIPSTSALPKHLILIVILVTFPPLACLIDIIYLFIYFVGSQ